MSVALHVVAAVIEGRGGRILIARRADHLHQGGLWEFPGGKVESGESARVALARELHEELGITVEDARPLIGVSHAYPDRCVHLDVWRVTRFSGEAHGREGQPILWVTPDELPHYAFPAANFPIITAARLPSIYAITPEPGAERQWPAFLARLSELLAQGIRLVQLRAHGLDEASYARLAKQATEVCHREGARLLLNSKPELVSRVGADGVHLSSARLHGLKERPLSRELWVGASCHGEDDLACATRLGLDFAVLSPVKPTLSHPGAEPLGWEKFAALLRNCTLTVYALGGLTRGDLEQAWRSGAQGIAAIGALWDHAGAS